MAEDDLAPCVTKPSAGMALSMQDQHTLLFHKVGFQVSAPSQEIIAMA